MALYKSKIGPQLSAAERNVDSYLFRQLRSCGDRARKRLVRERLSNTPLGRNQKAEADRRRRERAPLARKSGRLQRDAQYFVTKDGPNRRLEIVIGRRAWYAENYEKEGRLRFREIARQEMERTLEDVRAGLPLVLKIGAGTALPAAAEIAAPVVDAARGELLRELGETFAARREIQRVLRLGRRTS
jgi:hypothetical protein